MNMIGHDDIVVDGNGGVTARKIEDLLLNEFTDCRQVGFGRGKPLPYGNIREDAPPFVGADGDEIRAGGGIVVFPQANLFSFGQVHSACLPFSRRGDPCGRPFLTSIPHIR